MSETLDVNYPWVEEFRPSKIEDVIGASHLVEKMNHFITTKSLSNLLFVGSPGTGKTTVAKILSNHICGPGNYLYINASDRNDINTIRTDVVNYCGTLGFGDNIKIIILDEADGMTPQSQRALRAIIEEYAKPCRFILTGNYGGKIIDALRSRCQQFDFQGASHKEIAIKCAKILKGKGVELTDKVKQDITLIVRAKYPDIRSCINTVQKYTKGNVFAYVEEKDDIKKDFLALLKEGKIKDIREKILVTNADYLGFMDYVFLNVKELTTEPDKVGGIIINCSEYIYKHGNHLIPEINFIAFMLEVVQVLKS